MKLKPLKIILLIIVIFGVFVIALWNLSPPQHIKDILIPNEGDYTQIAEIYYEDSQKYTDLILAYSPCYENADGEFLIHCYSLKHDIVISADAYRAFQIVNGSFRLDKHQLERVYVYDTFVTFGIENGRESFIYSVEGKKPSYVNNPNEESKRNRIRKITDHWYYACSS